MKASAGLLWDGRSADELINHYIKAIVKKVRVRAAVLIGSRARGDWKPWSDVDLLLLLDNFDKEEIKASVVDIRPYTWDELIEAIRGCEVEVIEAFEEGIVLLNDGSWEIAKKVYAEVKQTYGIKKYKDGWMIERRRP